jgi:hypothetical protein
MTKPELRRYRRIPLSLPVRIVVNGIDEYDGRLVNISPGNLAVSVDAKVVTGDGAVVSIKGLDVIEGTVARKTPDGFALSFRLSLSRRQILVEKLLLLANQQFADGLADRRRAPRHPAGDQRMVCRLADGSSLFVRVLERSADGLSVDSQKKPPVGSTLHVGRARAVVARHTPRGFVALYEPQETPAQQPRLRAVQ